MKTGSSGKVARAFNQIALRHLSSPQIRDYFKRRIQTEKRTGKPLYGDGRSVAISQLVTETEARPGTALFLVPPEDAKTQGCPSCTQLDTRAVRQQTAVVPNH